MKTIAEIFDFVGRDELMAQVGVARKAMQHVERQGIAPASWYHVMETMAGRPLPRDLFSFKQMKQKPQKQKVAA